MPRVIDVRAIDEGIRVAILTRVYPRYSLGRARLATRRQEGGLTTCKVTRETVRQIQRLAVELQTILQKNGRFEPPPSMEETLAMLTLGKFQQVPEPAAPRAEG